MIRYSERIRRFSATAPPSNRFDWSSCSKRKKEGSPLAARWDSTAALRKNVELSDDPFNSTIALAFDHRDAPSL